MNKQELEKLFDEKVTNMRIFDEYKNDITYKVKQFIFETVIPEVLKEIIPKHYENCKWCSELKIKAKELYWIEL